MTQTGSTIVPMRQKKGALAESLLYMTMLSGQESIVGWGEVPLNEK